MPENINNINESTRHFMVLDLILRRVEDADNIIRTIKEIDNSEAAESFKAGSHFDYQFLPNKRRVFMPKGVNANSSVYSISTLAVKEATLRFDS